MSFIDLLQINVESILNGNPEDKRQPSLSTAASFSYSPGRGKVCNVKGGTSDDSDAILKAFQQCNNGGHVILNTGVVYTVGKALDLRFLKHIDWEIRGTLKFTNDTTYWQENSFKYDYQSISGFFALGGTDVNVFGGGRGLIDGGGQVWWDLMALNSTTRRPQLFNVDGLNGGTFSNLKMLNPPNWINIIQNSKNIVISDMDMQVLAVSANPAKNTDGWDTYLSSKIVIQNSRVDNTDDCVSFKPNSTQILVQGLWCNGSHGVSVGSLGQYVGVIDIVEDILVYNISMNNAGDGARIKVFPGAPDNVTLSSGGGSGHVKNVVYDTFHVHNVDWSIELTGCYAVALAACALRPAKFAIEDVLFKDFDGVTSAKNKAKVATLACPSPESCTNITAVNFEVKSTLGTNDVVCANRDEINVIWNVEDKRTTYDYLVLP
ncbi:pectin lyase fold/virulence factor [Leptodontidium sp. 2 PMI_412]|nr:pectin lyase fold/virulence factor [Leptodontidium sp. 2 PMI_412]